MRVGRSAANLYNLRVQSTARTAASLIATSPDPRGTLGLFLGTLTDSLSANRPTARAPNGTRLPSAVPSGSRSRSSALTKKV